MYGFEFPKEKEYTFKQIAKSLGVGSNTFLKELRNLGILDRENRPLNEYKSKGLYYDMITVYPVGMVYKAKANDIGVIFLTSIVNDNSKLFKQKKAKEGGI